MATVSITPKSLRRATICKVDKRRVQRQGLRNGQCANGLGWRAVAVRDAITQSLLAHLVRPTMTGLTVCQMVAVCQRPWLARCGSLSFRFGCSSAAIGPNYGPACHNSLTHRVLRCPSSRATVARLLGLVALLPRPVLSACQFTATERKCRGCKPAARYIKAFQHFVVVASFWSDSHG